MTTTTVVVTPRPRITIVAATIIAASAIITVSIAIETTIILAIVLVTTITTITTITTAIVIDITMMTIVGDMSLIVGVAILIVEGVPRLRIVVDIQIEAPPVAAIPTDAEVGRMRNEAPVEARCTAEESEPRLRPVRRTLSSSTTRIRTSRINSNNSNNHTNNSDRSSSRSEACPSRLNCSNFPHAPSR